MLRAWIELSRPSQWVKNLALFVAPLFGRALSTGFASGALPWTFLAFCAFASAGYAVNDRLDVVADRRHAEKRRRPFARGAVTRAAVTGIVACWTAIGVVAAWCAEGGAAGSLAFALSYFAGTLAYSFVLKRLFVVDVLALAGLFVVRIYAGACAAGVPVSPWLAACSVLGACVVGFGKRLAEVDRSLAVFEPARDGANGEGLTRATLLSYRQSALKAVVLTLLVALAGVYAAYTFAAGTTAQFSAGRMPWTLPFAVLGLARYGLIALLRSERIEDPARLLWHDRWLAACAIGWVAVATWAVAGHA